MRVLLVTPRDSGRVVIVGGSGFIGRHLTGHLSTADAAVLVVSSKDVDLRIPGSGAKLGALLRAGDTFVMCSALTPEHGRDAGTLIANVTIAKEACDALRATPPEMVVYMSSDAVYSDGIERLHESACAGPSTLYGQMHATREIMFAETGLALATLRPCAVYGPGDTHGSYGPNRFVRTALADGTISLFGHGEERRDHIFVRDLAFVIAGCIRQRITGTFNVATGRSVTFMEVAQLVARLAQRPVEIRELPRAAGSAITHRSIDIANLRAAMPEFRPTELEAGIRETISAAVGGEA